MLITSNLPLNLLICSLTFYNRVGFIIHPVFVSLLCFAVIRVSEEGCLAVDRLGLVKVILSWWLTVKAVVQVAVE